MDRRTPPPAGIGMVTASSRARVAVSPDCEEAWEEAAEAMSGTSHDRTRTRTRTRPSRDFSTLPRRPNNNKSKKHPETLPPIRPPQILVDAGAPSPGARLSTEGLVTRAPSSGPFHWEDDRTFRRVEAERAEANDSAGKSVATLFISHCWRKPELKTRKWQIVAELSRPSEEGGPGFAYWSDFLKLQAEGPVPWRQEIESGICNSSKMVALLDEAWLTSFNCLQELAYAIMHGKPVAPVILDAQAWDILTTPGGAAKCWDDSTYGPPLSTFDGQPITSDLTFSRDALSNMFSYLSGINFCPARPLDELNAGGLSRLLELVVLYVSKDLEYFRQHAELRTQALKWEQRSERPSLLLHKEQAENWSEWIRVADKVEAKPPVVDVQRRYVQKSTSHSKKNRKRVAIVLAVLFVLILMGLAASVALAIAANKAMRTAQSNQELAMEKEQEAQEQKLIALRAIDGLVHALGARGLGDAGLELLSPLLELQETLDGTWTSLLVTKQIILRGQGIGDDGLIALSRALRLQEVAAEQFESPRLQILDLSENSIGYDGMVALREALRPAMPEDGPAIYPTLSHLIMENMRCPDMTILAEVMRPWEAGSAAWAFPHITKLQLGGNSMDLAAATALGDALAPRQLPGGSWAVHPFLKGLEIPGAGLGNASIHQVAGALAPRQQPDGSWAFPSQLEVLDFAGNPIGNPGISAVAEAVRPRQLANKTWVFPPALARLSLSGIGLEESGAEVLGKAMEPRQQPDGTWAFYPKPLVIDVTGNPVTGASIITNTLGYQGRLQPDGTFFYAEVVLLVNAPDLGGALPAAGSDGGTPVLPLAQPAPQGVLPVAPETPS